MMNDDNNIIEYDDDNGVLGKRFGRLTIINVFKKVEHTKNGDKKY